jgi:hypothetical protein
MMADDALAAALSSLGLESAASLASLPDTLVLRIFGALGAEDLAKCAAHACAVARGSCVCVRARVRALRAAL